jgi:hypothetical protein
MAQARPPDSREPAPTEVARAGPTVVGCTYVDEVRAEQAAQALRVWARAQRGLKAAPVAVLGRRLSGTSTYHPLRIVRPGRGLVIGLLVGLVLFGLPAAGAAALAGWVVSSLVFGLMALIGVIPVSQHDTYVFATTFGLAFLALLIVGAVGVLLGAAIGALVGLIDSLARGFSGSERTRFSAGIAPGTAAVVTRTSPVASGLVQGELERLGGQPMELAGSISPTPVEPTDANARIAPT